LYRHVGTFFALPIFKARYRQKLVSVRHQNDEIERLSFGSGVQMLVVDKAVIETTIGGGLLASPGTQC